MPPPVGTRTPDPLTTEYPAGCTSGAGKECYDKGYTKGYLDGMEAAIKAAQDEKARKASQNPGP